MSHYQTISSIQGRGMDGVQTKMGLSDQYFLSSPICLILFEFLLADFLRLIDSIHVVEKFQLYACFTREVVLSAKGSHP